MLGRTYEKEVCSAARALEIIGERWSLLILRNAMFANMTRFSEFQRSLGIAPNILTARLEFFVKEGIFTKSPDEQYLLTLKGHDFKPSIIALLEWGDRWAAPDGPPIAIEHERCGGPVGLQLQCRSCLETPELKEIKARKTSAMEVYRKKRGLNRV